MLRLSSLLLAAMSLSVLAPEGQAAGSNTLPLKGIAPLSRQPQRFHHAPPATISSVASEKAIPRKMASDVPTIYGNLIYSSDWNDYDGGIYSILPTPDAVAQPLSINGLYASGGGVWLPDDNLYVAGMYSTGITGEIYDSAIFIFDADTWEVTDSKYAEPSAMAWDLCYNPFDGKIYGCFPTDAYFSGVYFGTLDYNTGEATPICYVGLPYMVLVAASDGYMYGIEQQTGDLYRISSDGKRDLVGNTSLSPAYYQSGTYDYYTDTFYWMACLDTSSALYSVDIHTAETTLIADYPTLDEWVGVFTKSVYCNDMAPAAVENVSISFEGASNEGTVSFIMPTSCYGGSILEYADYKISVNDEVYAYGHATAGESISTQVKAPEGLNKFSIEAVNEIGNGPKTVIRLYVGFDTPVSPENIVAEGDVNSRTIFWSPVTNGLNGGNLDVLNLSYDVTRLPDNVIIAEDISETMTADNEPLSDLAAYRYTVTAHDAERYSEKGASNPLVLGNPIQAPFESEIYDYEHRMMYAVEDSNQDGASWSTYTDSEGRLAFRYRYSEAGNAADDWLFSPPVYLEKDKVYELSTVTGCVNYPERMEIMAGTRPNSSSMSEVVADSFEVIDNLENDGLFNQSSYFSPNETGVYYFGFHAISEPDRFYLFFYSWEISEPIDQRAPQLPSEVKVTADENGEFKVTISFLAPDIDCVGNPLTDISRITIYDEESQKEIEVIENPVPGKHLTVTDNRPAEGMNYYEICASNKFGEGKKAKAAIWVGLDYPMAPVVDWKLNDDKSATIFWTTPGNIGEHGGYVNVDELTYSILSVYPDFDFIAKNITGNEFTDSLIQDITDRQESIHYRVYARNATGRSELGDSHIAPVGKGFATPFAESFSNCYTSHYPWSIQNSEYASIAPTWGLFPETERSGMTPQDNDGGMNIIGGAMPGEDTLVSPLITLPKDESLTLSFYASRPDPDATLEVMASTDSGFSWESLAIIGQTALGAWEKIEIPLDDFTGKTICVGFKAFVPGFCLETAIDNILIDRESGIAMTESETQLQIFSSGNTLHIANYTGMLKVYSADGSMVAYQHIDGNGSVILSKGVFIICTEEKTAKIMIK